MKVNEITTNERINQLTPEEYNQRAEALREEIKRDQEEFKKHEAAAGAALEEWRAAVDSKGLKNYITSTKKEERPLRRNEEETKKAYNIKDLLKIKYNNYKFLKWLYIQPAIVELMQEYEGKPYGEKTKEELAQKLYNKVGYKIYFKKDYRYSAYVVEINQEGYHTPGGLDFDITAATSDHQKYFTTDNNKIAKPDPACWRVSGLKPFTDDPAALLEELQAERKQARKLAEELRELCSKYNNHAPEGFEHLDFYRPASI